MRYPYYPGCAMNGTGKAYEESLVAVLEKLGSGLDEIDDWNCCGATAWSSIDKTQATTLAARNLAIAQAKANGSAVDLVAPCSGCYRALVKTHEAHEGQKTLAKAVDRALDAVGLSYDGRVNVRHPLDVLVNDIGIDAIAAAVKKPLSGIKVACYYGCLLVRPHSTFDDQYNPTSMDRLMEAIGAEPIEWPLKTRCCGGACYGADPFSGTMPEATLSLGHAILREARRRGADVVATPCALCLFNLEGFQDQIGREFREPVDLTVGFFTQLLGLAMGLDERKLGIQRMLHWRLPEPQPVAAKGGIHARA